MARFVVECPYCGARNSIRFAHCVSCGKELPDSLKHIALPGATDDIASKEEEAPPPNKLKYGSMLLLILAIGFLVLFGASKIYQHNQQQRVRHIPLLLKNKYVTYKKSAIEDTGVKTTVWSKSVIAIFGSIMALFIVLLLKLFLMYRKANVREKNFKELAVTDELTKLYSHRYLMIKLEEEFKNCKKRKQPLSFAILDVDHFKKFNDTYGHEVGNLVLQMFGAVMRDTFRVDSSTRHSDILARYGGEEFCVVFIGIKAKGAYIAAERFRRALEQTVIPTLQDVNVTVSIGIAEVDAQKGITDVKKLIESADQALYQAKENGRNQVVIFSQN